MQPLVASAWIVAGIEATPSEKWSITPWVFRSESGLAESMYSSQSVPSGTCWLT